ncbi:exoribonuclease R [Cryobacterium mesophilum]|uniref:RNB domain-containing ribonuclease n=1 Tax=Terrimesophilobacter mesophilus TaxID=433647 RepID=A0A4R8VCT6_9MICO|nr:RNB domain-containing ribonuclease [Terrimesophilobacter mesophilus]MBB5632859.1 exoribonuclease R [Terrimesophilobacter mesophilus]TFB79637.1 RNB domain-containing ribonuclease [Terrimesophilobacter mesophilus]
MPLTTVRLGDADGELAAALAALRAELDVTAAFPAEVEAEARTAAADATLPDADLLDVPFFTIDPAGSLDLDQAMHLERTDDGYRVRYAIADVPAFVRPGGAIDAEARSRGQTLYLPDGRIPLHPLVISEEAASLLPGQVRGAYVWTFELDREGRQTAISLGRARIRSTERLDYETVQSSIDAGTAPESLALLKEIGLVLIQRERDRGGASLGRPEQEVRDVGGRYELIRRHPLPAEDWNAQISVLTGMAAARIMIEGRVGILRTMPPPSEESISWFRRRAAALGTPWPATVEYGEYLRTLDPDDPRQLAIMHAAASLFRGAGYTVFEGDVPENSVQSAVGAPYAHTTAPLRRLVDRFVLVVCDALANGRSIPAWARTALPELPPIMAASDAVAGRADHAAVSAVEAAVLSSRVGEEFDATVIAASNGTAQIQLVDPAVTASCDGDLEAGAVITARLVTADIATGTVRFTAKKS